MDLRYSCNKPAFGQSKLWMGRDALQDVMRVAVNKSKRRSEQRKCAHLATILVTSITLFDRSDEVTMSFLCVQIIETTIVN
jgi:hypothetical protein